MIIILLDFDRTFATKLIHVFILGKNMTLPQKMTAAVLTQLKKPLEIMEIELPKTLDAGQVCVKVFYSGICGSQLGEINGAKGDDKYLPHLLGHEASGEVIEVGAGVRYVKPGDHVILHWRKGLGIDSVTPTYFYQGNKINAGPIATFNEYAIVSENRLTPIPAACDMKTAALFGCAITSAFGTVINNAKLSIGESVVVFGAGGVGLNVIQAAAMLSAYPVIAVDRFPERLALAKKLGATHLINTNDEDANQKIREILGKQPLDCFIDNTGNTEIIAQGYKLIGSRGRVILVGVPMHDKDITIHSLPLHFGKSITGSHGGESIPHEDIPRYYRLYEQKRMILDELITGIYSLADINKAMDDMRNGKISGRCVIKMS